MPWALIIHGGAGRLASSQRKACRAGCAAALAAGSAVLAGGGTALDAVECAIRLMEDDPAFNAGTGAVQNAEGEVELDAAMMDGATLDVGGVAAIRGVRHPISIARLLLRETPILLAATGAQAFARAHGAEPAAPDDLFASSAVPAVDGGGDTVGAVALDGADNLAAGGSTGGLAGKLPGRIGDTPLPGAGFYADNGRGGVALSGEGEAIARLALATRIMHELAAGDPQAAVARAIADLARLGEGGAICLSPQGRIGWAHNTPDFTVGIARDGMAPRVYLAKAEEEPA
jgi:beta-aspartyl-peptidase (threonine type)